MVKASRKAVVVAANKNVVAEAYKSFDTAYYAFDNSRGGLAEAGKRLLGLGETEENVLQRARLLTIWKRLGNPVETFQPAPVLALLAQPGNETKPDHRPDETKRTEKEEAAVNAAKTAVSRVRGALGLIAKGKDTAPESNAAQIARRKADKVAADKVKATSDLAAPKHTAWPEADASWMALADMLEQRVKQNPEFVRGPVGKDALALVKSIREHCKALDA